MEQTHSSIVTKRLKTTLRCDRSQILYQQVIERNFQIIGDLLKKLDKVFTKHQEFEFERMNHTKRLIKVEADIEAIHNQYRRENLQIASKIEELKLELNGIDKQLRLTHDGCNRKAVLKSFKIIDNLELHSQKCVSNCEDLFTNSPKVPKELKNGLVTHGNPYFRENLPVKNPIPRKSSSSKPKDSILLVSQDKNLLSTSILPIYREQAAFRRKTKNIKQPLRKSLESKSQKRKSNLFSSFGLPSKCSNIKAVYLNEQGLEKNQYRQTQLASLNCSFNEDIQVIKNEAKCCQNKSQKLAQKVELREIQGKREINQTIVMDNLVKETCSSPKNNREINWVDSVKFQQKMKETLKKIDQCSIEIKKLWIKIQQSQNNIQTTNGAQLFVDEVFRLKKEIQYIQQTELKGFATKKQIKQIIMWLDNKVQGKVENNSCLSQNSSMIVSKCLGCNRNIKMNEASSKFSFVTTPVEERKKKMSMRELKKRTQEVLKDERAKSRIV